MWNYGIQLWPGMVPGTHTNTHKHTHWFLRFMLTFHRRNGYYTVQIIGITILCFWRYLVTTNVGNIKLFNIIKAASLSKLCYSLHESSSFIRCILGFFFIFFLPVSERPTIENILCNMRFFFLCFISLFLKYE